MSAIATTLQDSTGDESTVEQLTTRQKIVIGGTGALAPILLNLLVVDLKTTFASISAIVVLGYLIRVTILFSLGGGMAYFHRTEKNALRLFELGIIAPALLTGVMNGTATLKDANLRASAEPAAATASFTDLFIPTAYAKADEPEVKKYSKPEESIGAQLWQGLSGRQDERVWFVVAGTFEINELQKARDLAYRIAHNSPDYKPQIYQNDKYYAVVIGENLTLAQAKARKEKAYEAKVPTAGDLYVYNPWDSK
ncbi:MAG TPA: hypothetical protein VGN90_00485 [Pyrinomonadaceae bacterium]|nr:hypothetical protein [Pyrinomonadaceae bacterium]